MLITSHDDLVVYSILALGYILFLINNNLKQTIRQQRDPLEKIKKCNEHIKFILELNNINGAIRAADLKPVLIT